MQTQDMTSYGHLIVRSEIAKSTLRLVDAEAESFGKDPYAATQELAATFASLAKNIRAGVAIDLSAHPTQEWDADFEAEFGPKTLANGIPQWTTPLCQARVRQRPLLDH